METLHLTCITCPLGCQLTVEKEGGSIVGVSGNTCPRGEAYARAECTAPKRMLTTTVSTDCGLPLPVKTETAVPKESLFDCMRAVRGLRVTRSVRIGEVVAENLAGTGVNLVATQNYTKSEE